MSHRPIEAKKRRKAIRILTSGTTPTKINLVEWLMDRGHAGSKKQARELILARKVKVDSHVVGLDTQSVPGPIAQMERALGREPTMVTEIVVAPLIDARHRKSIIVL